MRRALAARETAWSGGARVALAVAVVLGAGAACHADGPREPRTVTIRVGERPLPLTVQVDAAADRAAPAADGPSLELLRQAAEDALQAVIGVPPVQIQRLRQAERALEVRRNEQFQRQARQLEQLLQPLLRAELEVIRNVCGELSVAVRREVVAAGQAAVETLAEEAAARQQSGDLDTAEIDPRARLHRGLAAALVPHVTPDLAAAYDRENTSRVERRAEAARVRIVAKLDEQLDLAAAQREAILDDLRRSWQPDWVRELDDRGGLIVNNHRPAPDFAEACILPHLDAAQRQAWQVWCRAAGSRMVGKRIRWQFDGSGLPPDRWWEAP